MGHAMNNLNTMKNRIDYLRGEEKKLSAELNQAESDLAAAIAEGLGVRIGTIVTTAAERGYGVEKKRAISRYRVCEINYCKYDPKLLRLWGITLRKDGTDGEKREIWRDWEVEVTP
jgi:hypothetical protein